MKQLCEDLVHCKILIVDDEPANTKLLERVLAEGGFQDYRSTNDSRLARSLFLEFEPDLVLLDLYMPHLDGYALLQQLLEALSPNIYLPILVLTADISSKAKQQALRLGARDFLTKPFDITEVLLRIRNLLETRQLHMQLREHNHRLEERVRLRTHELEEAQAEVLERLAVAGEYRDDDTGAHTRRVGSMSERLALALGLAPDRARIIGLAARFHDIGKIGIPDSILRKPGPLTSGETSLMRTHTTLGASILAGSRFGILQVAETIALTHHQRFDEGGEEIPIEGRIVAVVDAFDAMVHDRPYRKGMPLQAAIDELEREAGKQFDARVVEAFVSDGSHDLLQLAHATQSEPSLATARV